VDLANPFWFSLGSRSQTQRALCSRSMNQRFPLTTLIVSLSD